MAEAGPVTGQHERFLERLKNSQRAVDAVAAWLRSKGRIVSVPQMQYAPTVDEAEDYADHGDIILEDGRRVEVKHRKFQFSGPHDWPFNDCFMSSEESVRRSAGTVAAYILVSRDLDTAAVITASTSDAWHPHDTVVNNAGSRNRPMVCPLNLVKFVRLPDQLCHCGEYGAYSHDGKRWLCPTHSGLTAPATAAETEGLA